MPSVGGDIEMMPVSDIALWVAGRQFSGTLSVRRRSIESRFTMRQGMCVQASSTDPREFLGQHLINFGHINEEQLQRAFDTQKETRVPLGRVLVMVEALTTAQLQTVLSFKTREGLLESLCWNEGSWRLMPDINVDAELDCERPVDLREAVSEGSARQSMWAEIRRVFPSDATRCDVLVNPLNVDSTFDRRLLQLMRDGRSVGEAALELRAMDFQVYARLYDLAGRQAVRPLLMSAAQVVRAPPVPAPAPAQILAPPADPAPPAAFPTPAPAFTAPPPSPEPAEVPAAVAWPPPPQASSSDGPAFSSGFSVSRPLGPAAPLPTPAPVVSPPKVPLPEVEIDVSVDDDGDRDDIWPTPAPPAAKPAWTPPSAPSPSPPPSPSRSFPQAAARSDDGFGTYMMVRSERVQEAPGVMVPPEAADPGLALRTALASGNWSETLLMAQRILEHDPLDSEAIAAFRVADAQLRRLEKQGAGASDADYERIPTLAMAKDDVARAHLTSKERYVLSRVDGLRSLQQIAAVSPVQRTELLRIVDGFVQRGVLRY
jgi:hypothetical protein